MTAPGDGMSLAEVRSYLAEAFPQVFGDGDLTVVEAADGAAVLQLTPGEKHLRPGGIVSGPTLMMLADAAAYAALLSATAGAKMAVTTNLNVSFLRATPPGEPILQDARILKGGRRLCVLLCEARTPAGLALAHATMTYAMPAG